MVTWRPAWSKRRVAPQGQMTLMEHLTELRRRLIISVIAIAACAVVVFILYEPVLRFLSGPYEDVTRNKAPCGPNGCDLVFLGPLDGLAIRVKIAGYGGIALSIPIIMWQIWRFVVPALHEHERRYAVSFVVASVLLFVLGCAVAWLTVDKALQFLFNIGGPSLQPLIAADKYLTLIMLMFIAFGAAFEFPVLLVFLLLVGALKTSQLRRSRRWAAVGITTFSAVITPSQDPFSLLFMAVPMYLFYETSIVIGRVMKK